MPEFVVKLSPQAIRSLDSLSNRVTERILTAIEDLKEHPFPRGTLIKKIRGKKATFYRLRVGEYRVYYCIEGRTVVILQVIAKKDAYRFIRRL